MTPGYYQKIKERLRKKACERYQNLSKEGKKSINMLIKNIKIFLKKKKNKSISINVSAIETLLNMKSKG